MQLWQLNHQVCKQMIVAGAFLLEQLLDFLICFVKPVLVFPGQQANSFSRGYPVAWSSSASTLLLALQLSCNEVFLLT